MELLKFLESIRMPFADTLFGGITILGEETFAIIVFCAMYWCIHKRAAYKLGVAYFVSGLAVQGMKICFRIERPWIIHQTLTPVPAALEQATGYSFPSGHTQSAAAVFASIGIQLKQKSLKIICFIVILLVAFSRLYLGVHTLLDVAASIIISLLLVLIAAKVLDNGPVNKNRELATALVIVLIAFAAVTVAAILLSGGKTAENYMTDCLKAAGAGIGFAVGTYIERVYVDFSVRSKNILLQIVKFILGIAGVLVFKEGLKLIIGTGFAVDTIRYFLVLAWITVLYPMIIKKAFQTKER